MNWQQHWHAVYRARSESELGRFAEYLNDGLEWIQALKAEGHASVLDMGGRAPRLVEDLLERGGYEVRVVDGTPAGCIRSCRPGSGDKGQLAASKRHSSVRTDGLELSTITNFDGDSACGDRVW